MSMHLSARNFVAVLALVTALVPTTGRAAEIGKPVTAGGFTFINFDPALSGTSVGSNANGISNRGRIAGTTVDANNAPTFHNFTGTPARTLPLNTGSNATAFGINSDGSVVGTENGVAFFLPRHGAPETLAVPSGATNAFGINDLGNIVGQYTDANGNNFGFLLRNHHSNAFTTIHAPGASTVVNAQGINNFGQIVGFYLGTDGQTHGFMAEAKNGHNVLTGTAIADPVIPNVPGEPGATFVFSQILGVNDQGIAVGYYGDSTTSQHGFLYDTHTGKYTFLDDPSEAFNNGVEVTQITGIADSGELSGFYTDANGAAHSFIACPAFAYCPNFPHLLDGSDESDDR
jgi:uncharacterized membrane protein